jgi:hypothetical protein
MLPVPLIHLCTRETHLSYCMPLASIHPTHFASLPSEFILALVRMQHHQEMAALTPPKSLGRLCYHDPGHFASDWESTGDLMDLFSQQGGMYLPPIQETTLLNTIVSFVRALETPPLCKVANSTQQRYQHGQQTTRNQLQQELDNLRSMVLSIQSRVGTLTYQVLAVLEISVNHRQSFQSLNDEVDALRIQLEEIRLQPAFQGQQEYAPAASESANSSPGPLPFPDLNISVQQPEDTKMEDADDQSRFPP